MLRTTRVPGPAMVIGLVVGLIFGLAVMALITFVQLGLCHLIAKWFFGGTGTYMGIMRPLLLAWFVNALILIPVVGLVASGIAWTAVLMLVFEEIDGIGRLQAFLISAGINFCFIASNADDLLFIGLGPAGTLSFRYRKRGWTGANRQSTSEAVAARLLRTRLRSELA